MKPSLSIAALSLLCLVFAACSSKNSAGLPKSGLRLWLVSTQGVPASGPVESWADQSGRHNDATQANEQNRPKLVTNQVNGLPALHFTQQERDHFDLPDVMRGAEGGDAFAVVRRTAAPISGLWWFGDADGCRYPEAENGIRDDFASTTPKMFTGNPHLPLTDFHLYEVAGGKNVWFQNLNGRQVAYRSDNTVGFCSKPLLGDGNGSLLDGDLAEVIIYDRVLTPAERRSVTTYISQKYGLSIAEPAASTK